jgi:hypothetical protein
MEEVAGGWRRLHIEELHNLYTSLNIIRMIKSRRMRWEGHVARMGQLRNAYKVLVGKPERKIILEWILGKLGGKQWIGCI